MRKLTLSKSGIQKLRSHHQELKVGDLEDSIKSLPPGEWCQLVGDPTVTYIAFINPLIAEKYSCINIVESFQGKKDFLAEDFIKMKIAKAFKNRSMLKGYTEGSRIFYGNSDGIPGLIIDKFVNASIIQINTAGVDRFRDLIRQQVEELTKKKAYFLDNEKYREKEFLPRFEKEEHPALDVLENGLKYHLRAEIVQKVGFYYDHRENRLQLRSLIERFKLVPKMGLDLFCYAGAWGMNALASGVDSVDFVDQGDFEIEMNEALKLNSFSGKGKFFRGDVFRFMDDALAKNQKYDLVMCDPPAFAKSSLQKVQALEGYTKLHRKVMRLAGPGALAVFSSCTHYVTHEEFQKNILDAALKMGRKIQLVHVGMQGLDHPVPSLMDRANYIKSYFYILE